MDKEEYSAPSYAAAGALNAGLALGPEPDLAFVGPLYYSEDDITIIII